jgi:hypothetical protein
VILPSYGHHARALTFNLSLCYIERKYKERKIKGNGWAWKKCIANEGTTRLLPLCLDIMLGHYAFCPASPWWLTLFPSKWFSLGMGFLLGTPLKSHHTVPGHTYHFPSLFPSISLSLGILGCNDPRRGCLSFYGKKGLKALRG